MESLSLVSTFLQNASASATNLLQTEEAMKLKEAERDAILVELVSAVGLQRFRFDTGMFHSQRYLYLRSPLFTNPGIVLLCFFHSLFFPATNSEPSRVSMSCKDCIRHCSGCSRSHQIRQDGQIIEWLAGVTAQGSSSSIHTSLWHLPGGHPSAHCARIQLFRSFVTDTTAESHCPRRPSWQPRQC